MVEKRNRLKVTRPGSLLSVLIDIEISDETLAAVRAAIAPEPFRHAYLHPGPQDCRDYEQCHRRSYGSEMERYQRESR